MRVGRAWKGYAWVVFLELGQLHEKKYDFRGKTRTMMVGEYTLQNTESCCSWELSVHGVRVRYSERYGSDSPPFNHLLTGRRLQRLEIDVATQRTRLTFSQGLVLTTAPHRWTRDVRAPHWLLHARKQEPAWRNVVLPGTHSELLLWTDDD